jgi:cytoskeletal protein RodZ
MSLVNDALKRAKEAQQQAAPPLQSQMQFRPVEPGQHVRNGVGLVMPVVLALVALLVLVLAWQWARVHELTEPREARAATRTAQQTTPGPQPFSASTAVTTPASPSAPNPPPQTESRTTSSAVVPDTKPAAESATPASATVAKEQEDEATNSAAIAPAPQPKPTPLRLQAIVYNPKRPSALISGKTVFIGDKLGDARVVAIDQDSATLVGTGKTNILSLPE